MGRFNTEEQFKFLISCIRYSNNGRVDFENVAQECKIVSKGAAAKRYERMMKAHQIGVEPLNDGEPSGPAPKEEPVAPRTRKRKPDSVVPEKAPKAIRSKPKHEEKEDNSIKVKREIADEGNTYPTSEWQVNQPYQKRECDFGPFPEFVDPAVLQIQGNNSHAAPGDIVGSGPASFPFANAESLSKVGDLNLTGDFDHGIVSMVPSTTPQQIE